MFFYTDESRVTFMSMTFRCGSNLISQMVAKVPGVRDREYTTDLHKCIKKMKDFGRLGRHKLLLQTSTSISCS